MTTSAVVLMIFSMAVLWGGLVVAIVHLLRADNPAGMSREEAIHRVGQERDL
jgi:hypothetical protein